MQTYEYKVLELEPKGFWVAEISASAIENKLNELASEGWELVNALDMNAYQGGTSKAVFIFKRAKTF
ncbi:DUF4177 domain-containing protein [Runella limosa]|uniref:DUF4177 domain-containing protein n=1 Tax=Runella limosa TaxID=370978 RepID=UPI00041D6E08|nr:DUF4177 domain-containing protein [Runella limosa]